MSAYCHWLKGMVDDLRALGETITDHHLVSKLLQGLNKKLNHMKICIKRSQLFPSFHIVHNNLQLEEIELNNLMGQGQASVFYSVNLGEGCPLLPQLQQPCPPQQQQVSPLAARHPLPLPPTMVEKARIRARGKARATTTMTLAIIVGVETP
jgi:hypothetical protein